jgi:hypothetical protein
VIWEPQHESGTIFHQPILTPYRPGEALRRCCISCILGRYSSPRSVQTLVMNALRRQGLGIGAQGDHHPHQRSQFTDSRTR